ncbi:hypothetical protein IJG91_03680, partial [Candidatus Saccharibacteria bacterium]|nr:hypothetical protein [Candidatus Saccharibacteria bacterium]
SAEGYVLKEWNTKADGTGTAYQPGDNFTIVADSSLIDPGERTLYAIWIYVEKWQAFLNKGGFDADSYENLDEAMQAEEVSSTIFNNQTAMSYLVENEDLLQELKQTSSYSETSVPNLLASTLYTDAEKYSYGLPFYIFNNGSTGIINNANTAFKYVYNNSSHSAYMNSSALYVMLSGYYTSCSGQMLWLDGTINTTKYVNTGIYVSSIGGNFNRDVGLGLNTEMHSYGFSEYSGGSLSPTSSGNAVTAIIEPDNDYYLKMDVRTCRSGSGTNTTSMTITKWWFE